MARRTKTSKPRKENTKAITGFLGINIAVNNTQLADTESPDMLNMLPDDRGALDKRPGIINIFTSLGAGAVNLLAEYRKSSGTLYLFSWNGNLYKFTDIDAGTYVQIGTGINNNIIRGITFNDLYYFFDGSDYYSTDGVSITSVTGYIPTILIGSTPAGGGTTFEQLNILSSGFTVQFTADGSSVLYQLPLADLDSDTVLCTVDGVTSTEGVDFTVNRTLGQLTFNVAPPATAPNNVVVTAFKDLGNGSNIRECTFLYRWGGPDGNRMWVSGNPSFINRDWASGLKDPTYFPENEFDDVGRDDNSVKGYATLYNKLIILKEKTLYSRQYVETDTGFEFQAERLNGAIGTVSTDSIQILDNFPTFVNDKGVYQLTSIDPFNEENVRLVSDSINRNVNILAIEGILEMGNLENYHTIDYDKKYWMFNDSNGIVWVYDYDFVNDAGIGRWFKLDNIWSDTPLMIGDNLYYGDSRKGFINRLQTDTDGLQYSDVEESVQTAIYGYWASKIFNFESITNLKLVAKIFFTLKPARRTSGSLYVRDNRRGVWRFIKTKISYLFSYSTLVYSTFTYGGNLFPQQSRSKIKAKKLGFQQVRLENNNINESFGILEVAFKFLYQREVKE